MQKKKKILLWMKNIQLRNLYFKWIEVLYLAPNTMKQNWGEKKKHREKKDEEQPWNSPSIFICFPEYTKATSQKCKICKVIIPAYSVLSILYACVSCPVLQCHPVEAILYCRHTGPLVEEINLFSSISIQRSF